MWMRALLLFTIVGGTGATRCVPSGSDTVPKQCLNVVQYDVEEALDVETANNNVTQLSRDLLDIVRHHTPYKRQYCQASIKAFSCFSAVPECASDKTLPPCHTTCEATALECGISPADLGCDKLAPSEENCNDRAVMDMGCRFPTPEETTFCSMVDYATSSGFHGSDFKANDRMAQQSYEEGSKLLPSAKCRALFKTQLCEGYFRRCDDQGHELRPCNTTCLAYVANECSTSPCTGPQYADKPHCFSLPEPEVKTTCSVPEPMKYCSVVDYRIDDSVDVVEVDRIAELAVADLVSKLELDGQIISDSCRERLSDLMCATSFPRCNDETAPPQKPCKEMCQEVARECGKDAVSCSDHFPSENCFQIVPSSHKYCVFDWMCPKGEYCRKLTFSKGKCLAKTSFKV